MQTTLEQDRKLDANDRCDRCGAQAYAVYQINTGGELLFCNHHNTEHGPALIGRALLVVDETEKLTAT